MFQILPGLSCVVTEMREGLPDALSGMWKVAVLRCSRTTKRPLGEGQRDTTGGAEAEDNLRLGLNGDWLQIRGSLALE